MSSSVPKTATPVGPTGTASSRVFDHLRKDLVGGALSPAKSSLLIRLKSTTKSV